jgi:hypothetical protein
MMQESAGTSIFASIPGYATNSVQDVLPGLSTSDQFPRYAQTSQVQ